MKAANQNYQKKYNRALVLSEIRSRKVISRADIARLVGLKKSSVTSIVADLINSGVVKIVGEGSSRLKGGRPPILLSINEKFGYVLGMEIQPSKYRYALVDLAGEVVERGEVQLEDRIKDFTPEVCEILSDNIRNLYQKDYNLIGVTVGLPGNVDAGKGIILESEPFSLKDFDFHHEIASRFSIPVGIENDSNCGAWAELILTDRNEGKSILYVLMDLHETAGTEHTFGIAIGIGLVIEGRMYYGTRFSAGDFKSVFWRKSSHFQLGNDNKIYASEVLSLSEVKDAVQEVLENLSSLAAVLDPYCIYLGGILADSWDEVSEIIETVLHDRYIGVQHDKGLFQPASFASMAVAAGAAAMFIGNFFSIPDHAGMNENSMFSGESRPEAKLV